MVAGAQRLSAGDKARLAAPVVLYAALAFAAWKGGYFREQNVATAAQTSPGSLSIGAAFVVVYGLVAAIALPTGPLAYGAGAIFGFWRASALVWVGSMLGAVAGYYLARGVMAKPARRLLGPYNEKLHDLRKGNVFLTALRLQLMPIVPFGLFNYAAAISKLEPLRFLAGTAVGIIPGTLLATFIGDRFVAGVHGRGKAPYVLALTALLVVLALSFAPTLWDKFRKSRRA